MSHKSIESEYYLELGAIAPKKSNLVAKTRMRGVKAAEQFSFISKGQWLLLLAVYGVCLLFLTLACIWIA